MEEVGIEAERLVMFNLGASDAPRFVDACNEMTERARRLGPNPLKREKYNSPSKRLRRCL